MKKEYLIPEAETFLIKQGSMLTSTTMTKSDDVVDEGLAKERTASSEQEEGDIDWFGEEW